MGSEDQVVNDIKAVFRKQKLRPILRIGVVLSTIIISNIVCLYSYAAARIAQSKERGVYTTVEEAVQGTYSQDFVGAQVQSLDNIHCGPNNPDGNPPFIWFCTATVKMDSNPRDYNRSVFLNGDFFIHIRDGWVNMAEGALPGFVGTVMELYHMEGVQ